MNETILRPRVGVAALVLRHDGAVRAEALAHEHGAGTWSVPGGHLETGESVVEAAVRELYEETGIETELGELSVHTVTHFGGDIGTYITLYAMGRVPSDIALTVREPDKFAELKWTRQPPSPLFLPLQNLLAFGLNPWTL